MRNKFRVAIVLGVIVLANAFLIYTVSGTNSDYKDEVKLPDLKLSTGDLVFRNGHGLISRMFQNCSLQEKKYGHTGIIIMKGEMPFVAHVQQDRPGPSLIVEPLHRFWNKDICFEGAVYRLDFDVLQKESISKVIQNNLTKDLMFDAKFDMDEHQQVYCSEWIRDMVVESTGDSSYFPLSMAGNFRYIAPDNLYLNKHAKLIYNYTQ